MQIPQNNGSDQPYYHNQAGEPGRTSPYAPPPYRQESSPAPNHPYQPPYDYFQYHQQQHGQSGHYSYSGPPQRTYASNDPQHLNSQHAYDGGRYSQNASPRPSHSPYDQQGGYHPPGPPPPNSQYGSAASYMNQSHEQPSYSSVPPPGAEEDRGVLGALAGGVTGAWAGHKVNHGFLGALGGAFAGHKLQDAVSDHKKHEEEEKKKKKHQEQKHHAPPPQQHQPRPQFAGNFTSSSTQMSIDKDFDLIASCRRCDGSQRLSSISLNDCLTNSDGHFRWAKGGNFGATARSVRLVDGGRTLEAELRNCGGAWVWSRIALDERIGNEDGNLVLV